MRRSPLIDMWYGLERDADGGLRMVVTWQPSALADRPRAPRPAQVALKAGMAEGGESFEQNVAPVATDSADGAARATFPVTAGRVQLDLEITTMDGTVIDHAAQDIDVPRTRGNGPVLLQPQLMRARTARDVEALAQTATVTPSPSRAYRRTERLLLRVPAYSPDGAAVTVTASLVNTRGQTIRRLGALPASPATGAAQFDVPLAFLAPADYGLEIRVDGPGGTARQLLRFELTG
jgi:hypothetical protein